MPDRGGALATAVPALAPSLRGGRVWNFSPGPAAIPDPVLQRVQGELLDWHGSGVSVMEMSHRGADFMAIQAKAEADLRSLLAIPPNYKVLFLQGGGIGENAIVPLNLLGERTRTDFVNTGHWVTRSIDEASRYCDVHVAATAADANFSYVPAQADWQLSKDGAYVHLCTNETIGGVEYQWTPHGVDRPIIADASSHILSRPLDISAFGLVFAGAQKNIGPAGLTLVIVDEALLGRARKECPSPFNYTVQAANNSMINTPPTFAIYMAGLVFEWLQALGGVAAIERANIDKAALLYAEIDRTGFWRNPVRVADRSRMNVPFFAPDKELDTLFVAEAKARGLVALKGHRIIGGLRASIYNAMPRAGVEALVAFMREFEAKYG